MRNTIHHCVLVLWDPTTFATILQYNFKISVYGRWQLNANYTVIILIVLTLKENG
jgi:hypothetical protein